MDETINILKYEPILIELLDPTVNDQEARILAMLYKSGGYITLNSLADKLSIAQPTISISAAELAKKGYIRKNQELMPIALVLTLQAEDLEKLLSIQEQSQRHAVNFLQEATQLKDITQLTDMTIRAFKHLYPDQYPLAEMIAHIYLNPLISREKLFQAVSPGKNINLNVEKHYENLLEHHQDLIQIVYKKHRKKDTYYQPQLPLNLLAESRWAYLQAKHIHYRSILEELQVFMTREYDAIIPHQLLQFPSELKLRIDTCLKYYNQVRIINNQVYQIKDKKINIFQLITRSKHFSNKHQLLELASKKSYIPQEVESDKIIQNKIQTSLAADYQRRDFILFGTHGCLIIPPFERGIPYYNISPTFIRTVSEVFESHWVK